MKKFDSAVITCDLDGKILSFDRYAEGLFKCSASDVVGIKRVYNLLQSDFILDFIKKFSLFVSNDNIQFEEKLSYSCFDGAFFSGLLRLERNENYIILRIEKISFGEQNSDYDKSYFEKLNIIVRSKFVIGSIMPFIFGILWSTCKFNNTSYHLWLLIFIGVIFFHIAANTFNDYFDWKSGRDKLNVDYVLFSTGGSRAIDFKFISERGMLVISILSFIIVTIIGLYFIYLRGSIILIIGLIALLSVYFYSAPPIHLASRYGLGELMHVFCLGPLIIYGTVCSLVDYDNVTFIDFIVGFPFGLLITGCLLMNEYPDSKFDKISGKMNLAVVLGKKYIPYMYIFLFFISFLTIFSGIIFLHLPLYFFLTYFILPYGIFTINKIFKIGLSRYFVSSSCIGSFNVYFYFSIILILSLIFEVLFTLYNPW